MPNSDKTTIEATATTQQFSNAQPVWHLVCLCVLTLGVYQIFWFYRHWKFMMQHKQLNINPLARAIFGIFFVYPFFKNVHSIAEEEGYEKQYTDGMLATFYIVLCFVSALPDPYSMVGLFSFVPLIEGQKALNFYWKKQQPDLPMRTHFSKWEIVGMIFGGILLASVVIGTFFPG
ncbi:MAG: hypothetical protein HQ558_03155 [Candidatus Omnitrophica bacterium]|nr:hypothetical protein [Candidatus Omnitrophota bacterium]